MSIVITDLSKRYGDYYVLDNLSFTFENGKKYVIKGENGAGKSTLIKSILSQIHYYGSIQNDGIISYTPEGVELPSYMQADDFIKTIASLTGEPEDLDNRIDYYLDKFNVKKYKEASLGSLSKGQKQKMAITLNLVQDSDHVLFDEPLNGLDEESKEVFISLLKEERRTVIVVTHEYKRFEEGFRILEISNGNIKDII